MKYYLDLALGSPSLKIRFNNITTKETEKVISSLHPKNSYSYDEILMKILKVSAPYTSSPVCYIFNKAISAGTFPSCLKYSIINSIHKKGDKENHATYKLLFHYANMIFFFTYTCK
jgi:hypothetical protein